MKLLDVSIAIIAGIGFLLAASMLIVPILFIGAFIYSLLSVL